MPAAPERMIECNPEVFRQNFNRLPHEVQHTLAANPLFQLPALAVLAQQVAARENPHYPQGDIYIDRGAGQADAKAGLRDQQKNEITKLVEEIERGQTWIILKHIEREPGYREVFENCILDIIDLAGKEIVKDIKWFEATLFITSPNRVTDYHIDRECVWLLQIQGEKEFHLFDRADKDVLPDDELERYWAVNNLSAVYKPQYESHAMVFHMRPGMGVHSPVNTPHWLKNGNNVSVSLSINFQFREHAWENLFRANYYLRRAGLTPASPGKHLFADRFKSNAYTALQGLRRSVKGHTITPPNHIEARQHYHRIVEFLASR
jgi:hypothetical protein